MRRKQIDLQELTITVCDFNTSLTELHRTAGIKAL
jgi:hypothetical protein